MGSSFPGPSQALCLPLGPWSAPAAAPDSSEASVMSYFGL